MFLLLLNTRINKIMSLKPIKKALKLEHRELGFNTIQEPDEIAEPKAI